MNKAEIDLDLERTVTPPGFRERTHRTARKGAAIVRMQTEAGRFLAVAAPYVDWVRQVAAAAGVEMALVREWAGRDLAPIEDGVGAAYAQLGDVLGLSRRFVRGLSLLGLAREMGMDLEVANGFTRGGADAAIEAVEAELDEIVLRLGPDQMRRWARLEEEIRSQAPRERA